MTHKCLETFLCIMKTVEILLQEPFSKYRSIFKLYISKYKQFNFWQNQPHVVPLVLTVWRCPVILGYFFFFWFFGHWNHTTKQILFHPSLTYFAATLDGIHGQIFPTSAFTPSSERNRGLSSGLLPIGFSSIV